MDKYHHSAVKFLGHCNYLAQSLGDTELLYSAVCNFMLYSGENACECSQNYRGTTRVVYKIDLILHYILKSVTETYGMIHINEASSGSLSIANSDL